MNKQEITRADSMFEIREENRMLKKRLEGFERIVRSLSLENDKKDQFIGKMQSANKKSHSNFHNRKVA